MQKLAIAATAAAFLAAGLVITGHVLAQGYVYPGPIGPAPYVNPPIGERGAKWGTQCWSDKSGGAYFGYWDACPKPKAKGKAPKS
jgi:hypothetical protein